MGEFATVAASVPSLGREEPERFFENIIDDGLIRKNVEFSALADLGIGLHQELSIVFRLDAQRLKILKIAIENPDLIASNGLFMPEVPASDKLVRLFFVFSMLSENLMKEANRGETRADEVFNFTIALGALLALANPEKIEIACTLGAMCSNLVNRANPQLVASAYLKCRNAGIQFDLNHEKQIQEGLISRSGEVRTEDMLIITQLFSQKPAPAQYQQLVQKHSSRNCCTLL